MIAEHETSALPFRLGTDDERKALRSALTRYGFTTEAICERMEIPSLHEFKTIRDGRSDRHVIADPLDLLIRVFIDGEAVPAPLMARLLDDAAIEALTTLGLLGPHPADPDIRAATVQLYPTAGLYLVSDTGPSAPGTRMPDEPILPDVVYSAITQNTGNFLRTLPDTPCDQLLELCSGTGIAALVGARHARHTWAVDITERSTRFAGFNAWLNGIENLTALQGDLYEPVAGLTFDRIVAHPPYVPAPERKYIYAHGGQDGEDIIRGVIAGLPGHLRAGGRFFCTCASTDRKGEPLEQRIRAMLGEQEAEFDVLVIEHYGFHPSEFYFHVAAGGKISFEEAGRFHLLFKELEAERRLYCTMIIQRHAAPRRAFTARRDGSTRPGAGDVETLLDWLTISVTEGAAVRVLDSRPAVARDARLQVTHAAVDGGWQAESCRLTTQQPFPRTLELSTNAAMLIAGFDGSRTAHEHLRYLREQGAVPDEMSEEDFARFVLHLVTEGALQLDQSEVATGTPAFQPGESLLL